MLYKTTGTVKDLDLQKRIVTGYYASLETLDSDNDVFVGGCFKKSINEAGPKGKNRIWHLWMHNTAMPINKPLMLEERKDGLYFETQLTQTPASLLAMELYSCGALTEHSIGFQIVKFDVDKTTGILKIKEAKIWEGSSVLWGANENTPFTGLKNEKAHASICALEALINKGTFDNSVMELVELEITRIKTALDNSEPQHKNEAGLSTSFLNQIRIAKFKL